VRNTYGVPEKGRDGSVGRETLYMKKNEGVRRRESRSSVRDEGDSRRDSRRQKKKWSFLENALENVQARVPKKKGDEWFTRKRREVGERHSSRNPGNLVEAEKRLLVSRLTTLLLNGKRGAEERKILSGGKDALVSRHTTITEGGEPYVLLVRNLWLGDEN